MSGVQKEENLSLICDCRQQQAARKTPPPMPTPDTNLPSDLSDQSDSSDHPRSSDRLLPRHGGYRKLRSFQTAQLVYDGTLIFCDRFIDKRSRTHDQMVQAARSGVQNIAEGSVASGTSKKTELKLTNVARASLEELMLDYQDFLRQHGLRLRDKDSPEALAVRRRYQSDPPDPSDPHALRTATSEVAANTLLCLINQASYLLGRQLENLDQTFRVQGGFTERLYAARTRARAVPPPSPSDTSDSSDGSDATPAPACPRCGEPMVRRIAKKGPHEGQPFWGCSAYPDCTGTRTAGASAPTQPGP
jgi:four helix bundle suffix protein